MNKLNLKILFFYILLLGVHIGLVWLLPYFPTQDGPSHVYNLVILKDLLNGGREWGNYFTYTLHAVPNLGFNLLSYPMLHFFPTLVVEKLFVSVYVALMGIGVYFFLHTFNKTSLPFIFFVFPVIFNFNLLMGFYSFVIAVPLFLIAFSFSWKIRNRSKTCKFVFFNIAGVVIFYFHLISFILFLLSLFCITIVQYRGLKKIVFDQIKFISIISPCLLVLSFYLVKSPGSLPTDFSYLFNFSRYIYLRNDLSFFSTVTFSPWEMLPGFLFTFLFLSFFILSVYSLIKEPYDGGIKIKEFSDSDKALIYLSLFLLVIYFIAPVRFGSGNYFNQRFPWVIFIILLPLLRVNTILVSKRFVISSIISVAVLFFAFNSIILWQQSSKVKNFLSGLNAGLPKGAYVMTYKKRNSKDGWHRVDVLMHAASYYGIIKGCVDIGNYETDFEYFPIHFKDTIPRFPYPDQIGYKAETVDWSEYPSIQYILGWEVDKNDMEKLSKFFHIMYKNDPFSLWGKTNVKGSLEDIKTLRL